jgi:murein DD-endopeptidase MepM/ murein hydrolase activator NlpD
VQKLAGWSGLKMGRRGHRPRWWLVAAATLAALLTCPGIAVAQEPLVPSSSPIPATAPASAPLDNAYKLPWAEGWTWSNYSGWHGTGYSPYALDFAPAPGTPREAYAVLAASAGTLTEFCGPAQGDGWQSTLSVANSDGATLYMHLDSSSVPRQLLGQRVRRGQFLGLLYTGADSGQNCVAGELCQFSTPCGHGDAVHLHFELPSSDAVIDGYASNDIAASGSGNEWLSHNEPLGYVVPPPPPPAPPAADDSQAAIATPMPEPATEDENADPAPEIAPVAESAVAAAPDDGGALQALSLAAENPPTGGASVQTEAAAPAAYLWQDTVSMDWSGMYRFDFYVADAAELRLDGDLIIATTGAVAPATVQLHLEPGLHTLRLECRDPSVIASFSYAWTPIAG